MLTKINAFLFVNLILIAILLSPIKAISKTTGLYTSNSENWSVQPKACIVEALGDVCRLSLDIILPALEIGTYCYFVNDKKLHCFDNTNPISMLELSFNENTLLSLYLMNKVDDKQLSLDASTRGPALFTQSIEIRTRTNQKKVRRIRDPWSLF